MDRASCPSSSQTTQPSKVTNQLNESLYELHKPQGTPRMQVLFFHGFQLGDYRDAHLLTWKSRDDSCVWPQTWLVDEFPEAHILTVSYNARLIKTSEHGNVDLFIIGENLTLDLLEANIGQEPNCPVILVGHSFGGLVMKQLCVHARRQGSSQHKSFLNNVKGLFFYGTPHHGIPFVEIAARLISDSPLLDYVRTLSTPAARLNHYFDNLLKKYDTWQIAGVGENLPTKWGMFPPFLVVPEASSRYGDFSLVGDANHITICRPKQKISTIFTKLTRLLHNINSKTGECPWNYQHLPKPLVGIDDTLEKVQFKLHNATSLGFVGMGGVGKTTLAMVLFNVLGPQYEYTCFIKDVKNSESFEDNGMLKHMHYRGRKVSKKGDGLGTLRGKRLLLVLDDVASEEDLAIVQTLTKEVPFMVHEDSRFVATSRDSHLLDLWLNEVYAIPFLSSQASEFLFVTYALPLGISSSFQGYVHDVVHKCEGLPLTLEVIGKYLHKKPELVWEQAIQALDKAEAIVGFEERLWAKLRLSYDCLDQVEQDMFLDAGTIYYMERIDDAKVAWSISTKGLQHMRWQHLVDMSLVWELEEPKFGTDKLIQMHEQLRSLARKIASTPGESGLRVWDSSNKAWELLSTKNPSLDDVKDIVALKLNSGEVDNMEYIEHVSSSCLYSLQNCLPCNQGMASPPENQVCILRSALCKMGKLRHLHLDGVDIDQTYGATLPSTLVSLEWHYADFTNLPFNPISHKHLAILSLKCHRLQTLPTSFGRLSSCLQVLRIECRELKSLPNSFGKLLKLEKLSLIYCKIQHLPTTFAELVNLKELEIREVEGLKTVPPSFGRLTQLQSLSFFCCSSLETLPESFGSLSRLTDLNIWGCDKLTSLPETFVDLESLEHLEIGPSRNICLGPSIPLPILPDSIGCLAMLQKLCENTGGFIASEDASDGACESLLTLPEYFEHLRMLRKLKIQCCYNLEKLPETFGNLVALESLALVWCTSLSTLPGSFHQLAMLKTLEIGYCNMFQKLPETLDNLVALERLQLEGCASLSTLPDSLGHLPQLNVLTIANCNALLRLPETIGYLVALEYLEIRECASLSTLPDSLGHLVNLNRLDIRHCNTLQKLPETLGDLTALEKLNVGYCQALSTLPDSLGFLPRLQDLRIDRCELLHELPNTFLQLKALEYFELEYTYLQTVPNSMENLPSLKTLVVSWTMGSRFPTLPDCLGEVITERNYQHWIWTFKVVSGQLILQNRRDIRYGY